MGERSKDAFIIGLGLAIILCVILIFLFITNKRPGFFQNVSPVF